jgi:hypothetical protein
MSSIPNVGHRTDAVRRDVEVAQIVDELVQIVSLVGAEHEAARPCEGRTTIVIAASRSA